MFLEVEKDGTANNMVSSTNTHNFKPSPSSSKSPATSILRGGTFSHLFKPGCRNPYASFQTTCHSEAGQLSSVHSYYNISHEGRASFLPRMHGSYRISCAVMIHPRVLKELAEVLTKPLSILYQQSWTTREVPVDWRLANVTPIYKKGQKEDLVV
ncbi:hypothetical protein QYF61_025969 [Mycteria americana]|uniref:Uncharacterized protein n=1 Tax=Mycteria americana TaxID=33587 RepID=A0AAN7NSZ3_MYCAM|nr:hypothetical protein QYF61_025969 [Mycteria americana]